MMRRRKGRVTESVAPVEPFTYLTLTINGPVGAEHEAHISIDIRPGVPEQSDSIKRAAEAMMSGLLMNGYSVHLALVREATEVI
jgi:hypothetical protein